MHGGRKTGASGEPDDGLRDRLTAAWHEGDVKAFYAAMMDAKERVEANLRFQHGLDGDEVEDCIATAYERLYERHAEPARRAEIRDPYSYFFTVAVNAANDRHRHTSIHVPLADAGSGAPEQGDLDKERADGDAAQGEPQVTVSAAWAVLVVEDAVVEVEADATWAVAVVRLAVSRLSPKQRSVVEHLGRQDFDDGDFAFNSQDAPDALGMTPAAFRQNKKRAYDQLRDLIPWAIVELGVTPPSRIATEIFPERRPSVPSEE